MKTGDWEVNEMQNILAALFEKESEGFQAISGQVRDPSDGSCKEGRRQNPDPGQL